MSDATRSADLEGRIRNLYGEVDWAAAKGVLHVAAIAASPRCVIAIGPAAPRSPVDRFVLGLARARADVIVSTGSILRSEPALVHGYAEDDADNAALADWRARHLGRTTPPALVVLSGSGAFPRDHSAFAFLGRGFIWTTEVGAARLGTPPRGFSLEQASARDEAGAGALNGAIARARRELGAQSILVEAGPNASAPLYAPTEQGEPSPVDELLLSRFLGTLEAEAIGPDFVSEQVIAARWATTRSACAVEEESGPWRFERYRNASAMSR